MKNPKISAAPIRCPCCAGPSKLKGVKTLESFGGGDLLCYECEACGEFEVLAVATSSAETGCEAMLAPGREPREMWV